MVLIRQEQNLVPYEILCKYYLVEVSTKRQITFEIPKLLIFPVKFIFTL